MKAGEHARLSAGCKRGGRSHATIRGPMPRWTPALFAEVCLVAAVLFCPLALGGAPTWTLWPLALFALGALACSAFSVPSGQGHARPGFAIVLVAGAVLVAL